MAKIIRATQKIFGETGPVAEFGQPGSYPAGTLVNTKDPATIQALAAYLTGLSAVVGTGGKKPAMEDLNSLLYLITSQIAYLMQEGIAEWDAGTTYYIGSIVKSGGIVYTSLQDSNLNKTPATETAFWVLGINGEGTYPGEYIISAQAADYGRYLLCPTTGRTVSRTTYAALFAVIGTKFGVGDGLTTFTLPNPAGGKLLAIKDALDADFNDFGKSGGTKTHTLTTAEMPPHKHDVELIDIGGAGYVKPVGNNAAVYGTYSTSLTGGGLAHPNLSPYLVGGNLFISWK
jgi:microcystin-dependent protein